MRTSPPIQIYRPAHPLRSSSDRNTRIQNHFQCHTTRLGLTLRESIRFRYDLGGCGAHSTNHSSHDIYKWQSHHRQLARPRAASYSGARPTPPDPAFEHIHEPGGFRRNFVLLRANEQGVEEPPRILNNFIDFLFIYGHFVCGPDHSCLLSLTLLPCRRVKTWRRRRMRTK
jgi:hypothetical protein